MTTERTIKTNELTDAALDWAVATCEGWRDWDAEDRMLCTAPDGITDALFLDKKRFSTDWVIGGPIIEREGINLHQHLDVISSLYEYNDKRWADFTNRGKNVRLVCRPLAYGPGRGIRETKQPGKFHGMWLASREYPSFGWRAKDHFVSPTPLIAAMRCYVASKLGNEVAVPGDLVGA